MTDGQIIAAILWLQKNKKAPPKRAVVLADMANFYRAKGLLTDRQIDYARTIIDGLIALKGVELEELPNKFKSIDPKTNNKVVKGGPGGTLFVSFPHDLELVDKAKSLPGREWDGAAGHWICPKSFEAVELLKAWGFAFDKSAGNISLKKIKPPHVTIKGLNAILRPYQQEGVDMIEYWGGRVLLADEMGLGKTIQAIAYLQLHPEIRPAVIVCPATLKYHWEEKINEWMTYHKRAVVVEGRFKGMPLPRANIYIVNYDILWDSKKCPTCKGKKKVNNKKCGACSGSGKITKCRKDILDWNPEIVIIDEGHYIKNKDSQRSKAVTDLSKKVDKFIDLTGTPLDKPKDIYPQIRAINPNMFPSFFRFAKKYCGAEHNGFGWTFEGASNTKELHHILSSTMMIRRKKSEVLKDLPPKTKAIVKLDIDNRREYQGVERDFLGWVNDNFGKDKALIAKKAQALTKMEALKQLAVKGKLPQMLTWIEDFIESGEKLVVFLEHKWVAEAVEERFPDIFVKIVGGMNAKAKHESVKSFQNDDEIRLCICSSSGKEGVTLTAASNVCFLELWMSPLWHNQAEDRVHRIGQESYKITAWYLLGVDTIEETVAKMLDVKMKNFTKIIDGEEAQTGALLYEILKEMRSH